MCHPAWGRARTEAQRLKDLELLGGGGGGGSGGVAGGGASPRPPVTAASAADSEPFPEGPVADRGDL